METGADESRQGRMEDPLRCPRGPEAAYLAHYLDWLGGGSGYSSMKATTYSFWLKLEYCGLSGCDATLCSRPRPQEAS